MLLWPSVDLSLGSNLRTLTCKNLSCKEYKVDKQYFRMFNANVKQVINVSQVVASKMISAGKAGSIVNVSSQVSFSLLMVSV